MAGSLVPIVFFALATVASALGPAPVLLGTAGNYAVIAKTGVSSVPQSVVTGDMGASPTAQTYYTGFSETNSDTGTYSTSQQCNGRLYAADNTSPTPSVLTTAVSDMETAFTDAAGRSENATLNFGGGSIAGATFAPGLYTWGSNLNVNGDCTLSGSVNDTWIFQVSGNLNVASSKRLILSGGAVAGNVVFVVSGAVTFGSSAEWNGIILSQTAIHMVTKSSINGRLLAQSAVTLQRATVMSYGLGGNQTAPAARSSSTATQKRSTRSSVSLL
ncbi:hypothetical protein RQP46_011194 [Phenoliferia psychrophenolica]